MSLKDFQLNKIITAGLYANVLAIPENEAEEQAEKNAAAAGDQAESAPPAAITAAENILQPAKRENIQQSTIGQAEDSSHSAGRGTENASPPAIEKNKNAYLRADEQAESQSETEQTEPIRFLGNNNNHILILTSDTRHAFLPEDHLALLIKMLEACKLNTGDTAIVNLAARPLAYSLLKEQLRPQKILFFGVDPAAIKIPAENAPFRIGRFEDCFFVCAPSLAELNGNSGEAKALKTRLWVCLQQLFLQKNDHS
ncbi:MAG TPA: hypothetical protein PK339_05525 [Flavitalea sp.]|nr:hypothetical protein [Flavitalea sp.]